MTSAVQPGSACALSAALFHACVCPGELNGKEASCLALHVLKPVLQSDRSRPHCADECLALQAANTLQELAAASLSDLRGVPGVGKVLASRIQEAVRAGPPVATPASAEAPSTQSAVRLRKDAAAGVVEDMHELRQSTLP